MNWVPTKLDVTLLVPQTLDLESLRGTGIKPTETAMPDDAAAAPAPAAAAVEVVVDEVGLMTLMSMGFDQAKCTKAMRECGNSVERATEWIFSHMVTATLRGWCRWRGWGLRGSSFCSGWGRFLLSCGPL